MLSRFQDLFSRNIHVKEVIRGSSFVLLAKVIGTALSFIVSLIIAKYYGADAVGLLAIIVSILSILTILGVMGTNVSILRLIPQYSVECSQSVVYSLYKKILLLVMLSSLILSIVLWFVAPFLAMNIFTNSSLYFLLVISAPFVLIQSLNKYNIEVIRALNSLRFYAFMQVFPALLSLFILVYLTCFRFDFNNPIYTLLFVDVIVFIILFYFIRSGFPVRERQISPMSSQEIIHLSFPMLVTSVMQIVITQTDVLMLGMLTSTDQVGIYSIVIKLAFVTGFILQAVNSVVAPKFATLFHSGDKLELRLVAQESAKLVFLSSLPIIIVYILFGSYILGVFGDEFKSGYVSLLLLTIGQLINAASGSVGYFLNMTGGQKVFRNIIIVSGLLNVLLNFILIPEYGISGAAFASMVSMILWNVLSVVYIRYKYGFYVFFNPFYRRMKG